MPSVLQDWVENLGLREQGTLLGGMRGCDIEPKESRIKEYTRYMRYCCLVPFDPREVDTPGAYINKYVPEGIKFSWFDDMPTHFTMHFLQAAQVLGFRHPNDDIGRYWFDVYCLLVKGAHLRIESIPWFEMRMNEDRIAKGNVVS